MPIGCGPSTGSRPGPWPGPAWDALLVETQVDLAEALLALDAALETGAPVLVSMTFGRPDDPDTITTFAGECPASCAEALEAAGAHAVGANCTLGPAALEPVVRELLRATALPVLASPNAGQPEPVEGGGLRYPATPEDFGAMARRFADLGIRGVGGCCGTTPAHVAAMREALDRASAPPDR